VNIAELFVRRPVMTVLVMAAIVIFGLAGVRRNLLKIKPSLIIDQTACDEVLRLLGESMQAVLRK